MNVEIGIEAAQFPGKKYINRIFLAVRIILLFREETPCEFVAKGAGGRMLRGNLYIQILAAR